MKKILLVLFLGSSIAFQSVAQTTTTPKEPKTPEQKAEAVTQRMTKRLALTADQSTQIKAINLEAINQNRQVKAEVAQKRQNKEKIDRESYKQRLMTISQTRDSQTLALLNDTQKAEYAKMKEQARIKLEKRRASRKANRKAQKAGGDEELMEDPILEEDGQ